MIFRSREKILATNFPSSQLVLYFIISPTLNYILLCQSILIQWLKLFPPHLVGEIIIIIIMRERKRERKEERKKEISVIPTIDMKILLIGHLTSLPINAF